MNFLSLNELNSINSASRTFFSSLHTPTLTQWMSFITDVGSPANIALYCLAFLMLLWLHEKRDHFVQFVFTLSVTAVVVVLIKAIVQLPRPTGSIISETGYSFASGHAMFSTVFFLLMLYSYKDSIGNSLLRKAYIALCILAPLMIGISRVYLGVHYMTDVLAGFLIGTIITCVSVIVHQRRVKG